MGLPAIAEVVLVPFPFSDLSRSKLRPALVMADKERIPLRLNLVGLHTKPS